MISNGLVVLDKIILKHFPIGSYCCLWEGSSLIYVCLCLFAYSGVQLILWCVFVLFFFVLCTLCCQFILIVHYWLPIHYSLTFIQIVLWWRPSWISDPHKTFNFCKGPYNDYSCTIMFQSYCQDFFLISPHGSVTKTYTFYKEPY